MKPRVRWHPLGVLARFEVVDGHAEDACDDARLARQRSAGGGR